MDNKEIKKKAADCVDAVFSDIGAEIALKLWADMSAELALYGEGGKFTPSLLVSKVRDYNRKWNTLAETNPFMKPDGFKVIAKRLLLENTLSIEFQDALKYL